MHAAFAAGAIAITAAVLLHPRISTAAVGSAAPLLLVGALAIGALTIRYSAAGAPLLVALVYMNLSEALVRYHRFPSVLQVLVVALAFAAWLKRDTATIQEVAAQPVVILLTAYILYAFASTSWAFDREVADERFGALLRAFLLFLLATLLMRSRARVRQGLYALLGAAAFLGVVAIVQAVTHSYDSEFGGLARLKKQAHIYGTVFEPRAAGTIGDPNFFAQVLLLVMPLAVMLALRDRVRWRRAASAIASAVLFVTLLLTYSRGAVIAMGVVALMLLNAFHVRWRSTAAAIALLAGLAVLLPPTVTQRVFTIEEILPARDAPIDPDSSFAERRLLMHVAWVMFAANPLFGVGIGNYSTWYDDYAGRISSEFREYDTATPLRYPHNLVLELGAEGGIAGLLLFSAAAIACWRALQRVEQSGDEELAPLARALRIGLAAFLVAGLFLHLAVPRHLFLLFAFAAALERLVTLSAGEAALPQSKVDG